MTLEKCAGKRVRHAHENPARESQGPTSGNVTFTTFVPDAIRDVENVIARKLSGLTDALGDRHLLLDFTNVEHLNSMELGTLVGLHKQVEATGFVSNIRHGCTAASG